MPNLQGQYRATRQQDVAPAAERQCREFDTWPNGEDFDPAILHDWRDHEASMIALAQRWAAAARGEPGKRGGKPCIRGLRITVSDVLEYLASGMTEDPILQDFPDLSRNDIRASLVFAADRERKFVSVPPA